MRNMIYPKPQQYGRNDLFGVSGTPRAALEGEAGGLEALAAYAGLDNLAPDGNIVIRVKLENGRDTSYIEETQTVTDEKYLLRIEQTENGADIRLTSAGRRGRRFCSTQGFGAVASTRCSCMEP